jgi:hypothetical protein
MIAFADYGDLEATGQVHGRIPVQVRGRRVRIHDALLQSVGDGVIRYRAPGVAEALDAANDITRLLVSILQNFLYDQVSMQIDELDDGDMRIRLTLKGRSPEGASISYGDLPVELYITLTGPLRELLNPNLDILDAASQIEGALGGTSR